MSYLDSRDKEKALKTAAVTTTCVVLSAQERKPDTKMIKRLVSILIANSDAAQVAEEAFKAAHDHKLPRFEIAGYIGTSQRSIDFMKRYGAAYDQIAAIYGRRESEAFRDALDWRAHDRKEAPLSAWSSIQSYATSQTGSHIR